MGPLALFLHDPDLWFWDHDHCNAYHLSGISVSIKPIQTGQTHPIYRIALTTDPQGLLSDNDIWELFSILMKRDFLEASASTFEMIETDDPKVYWVQKLTSNEQRATSNEQRATSNEQRATSNEQRATSNEQQ